jgi:hypothetical protein
MRVNRFLSIHYPESEDLPLVPHIIFDAFMDIQKACDRVA